MKPRIAITLGDPKGIGPEIVAKALADAALLKCAEPIIFGDKSLLQAPYIAQCTETEAAEHAANALSQATDALLAGEVAALATAPLQKSALLGVPGGPFMGHTGYLAYRCKGSPLMTFYYQGLCVGLLTVHVPIVEVPRLLGEIGSNGIARRLDIFAKGLRNMLGIAKPRIALLGLNPHAGEDGLLGDEEHKLLVPAMEHARRNNIDVHGPFAADGLFNRIAAGSHGYDGVMACYHDQGLVGFKSIHPHNGSQLSMGLGVIRTSCKHGTARDIAGQDTADPRSMVDAIALAAEIAQRQ